MSRTECIQATFQKLNRSLTTAETQNIERVMLEQMRKLAAKDRAGWQAMTQAERFDAAANEAAKQLEHVAVKKQQRINQTIITTMRREQLGMRGVDGARITDQVLATDNSGNADLGVTSIMRAADARAKYAVRNFAQSLHDLGTKFFGLIVNKQGSKQLIQELRGESSGNATAKKIAQEFLKEAEIARKRKNALGGDVGKLEDWGGVQSHDGFLVSSAHYVLAGKRAGQFGADAAKEAWGKFILPLLDRSKYVDENGVQLNDAAMGEYLSHAWESIAYDGFMKRGEPGAFKSTAVRANRGSAERSLHFLNADAYIKYHEKFGGKDVVSMLTDHLRGEYRDIALMEMYGPNPDYAFNLDKNISLKEAMQKVGSVEAQKEWTKTQLLYNHVAGVPVSVYDPAVMRGYTKVKAIVSSNRLGGVLTSMLSDPALMNAAASAIKGNKFSLWASVAKATLPKNREFVYRQGLALETMVGQMTRLANEIYDSGQPQRWLDFTMRVQGANLLNEVERAGFGTWLMHETGSLLGKYDSLAKLDDESQRWIRNSGITDEDWQVWRKATLDNGMLTPEAIHATGERASAEKFLGYLLDRQNSAILQAESREAATMDVWLGKEEMRGTHMGELKNSVKMYKSFPLAYILRIGGQILGQPTKGKAFQFAAFLAANMMIFGTMVAQVRQLTKGEDLYDWEDPRTYGRGFMMAGGLGIFGDFLYNASTRHGNTLAETVAGPLVGEIATLTSPAIDLIKAGFSHNETEKNQALHQAAGDTLSAIEGTVPALNVWYWKAMIKHAILNHLHEMVSPGYLDKAAAKNQKTYGTGQWWKPNDSLPYRMPEVGKSPG